MSQQNLLPLSVDQRATAYPRAEDEIDLIELFQTIWSQKAKIALVTLVTTLAAGVYAFTTEEVWTSKAVFDPPKLEEINEYYTVTQQLKRILQSAKIGDVALEPKKITADVYSEFMKQIDSDDLRKEFWSASDYYAEKIKGKTSTSAKSSVLNRLIDNNIKTEVADGKKVLHPSVSLSANSAPVAKKLLEQYLERINETVRQQKITELNIAISQLVANLDAEKKRIKFNAETQRDNSIKISQNAKNIAKKANIKDFNINAIQGNANVAKTDMLFFLGTKALDAQLDNLTNNPLILPVRYYQIEQILTEIKALPSLRNLNIKSYRYLMSPREPVTKDKPKRTLILVLGVVLGGLLGIMVALCQHAINRRRVSSCNNG